MKKGVKPLSKSEKKVVLRKARKWFVEKVIANHKKNTKKLSAPKSFRINPFTAVYLANFLSGDSSPLSIARALVYSRALGSSIVTTFGSNIQDFTTDVLVESVTSIKKSRIPGMDFEFTDFIDHRWKACQLKAGPNNINKSGVKIIHDHVIESLGSARGNRAGTLKTDYVVGVVYGTEEELSAHYRKLRDKHKLTVSVGAEFWERLTGDPDFYEDLIASIREVVEDEDFRDELESIALKLSKTQRIIEISQEGDPV